jgi:hypothetical protein
MFFLVCCYTNYPSHLMWPKITISGRKKLLIHIFLTFLFLKNNIFQSYCELRHCKNLKFENWWVSTENSESRSHLGKLQESLILYVSKIRCHSFIIMILCLFLQNLTIQYIMKWLRFNSGCWSRTDFVLVCQNSFLGHWICWFQNVFSFSLSLKI